MISTRNRRPRSPSKSKRRKKTNHLHSRKGSKWKWKEPNWILRGKCSKKKTLMTSSVSTALNRNIRILLTRSRKRRRRMPLSSEMTPRQNPQAPRSSSTMNRPNKNSKKKQRTRERLENRKKSFIRNKWKNKGKWMRSSEPKWSCQPKRKLKHSISEQESPLQSSGRNSLRKEKNLLDKVSSEPLSNNNKPLSSPVGLDSPATSSKRKKNQMKIQLKFELYYYDILQ